MIRTVKNTLEPEWDRWDDPGDYPSGAGSGPLPSEDFCAGFEGDLVLKLTGSDVADWREWFDEGYGDEPTDLPYHVEDYADAAVRLEHGKGVNVRRWAWTAEDRGDKITITMHPAEAEVPAPEPYYEPWED